MSRSIVLALASLASLACTSACDRVLSARVTGRVSLAPGTTGALVFPLDGAKRASPVDPDSNTFVTTYGALNVHPSAIPLLVYVPGAAPLVLVPGRDFDLKATADGLQADVFVDPSRAPASSPLELTCENDACTADLPAKAGRCSSTVVVIDGTNVSLVAPGSKRLPDGGERLVALFPLPRNRPRELVVVSTCGKDIFVSPIARFDGS